MSDEALACRLGAGIAPKLARLAQALHRAGLLKPCEPSALLPRCREALGLWLDSVFGGLRHFDFTATLHASVFDACGMDRDEEACELQALQDTAGRSARACLSDWSEATLTDPRVDHVGLTLAAASRTTLVTHDGVQRLEAECRGLGWLALREACTACQDFELYGLGWSHGWASYAYWGGCESEVEYMADVGFDDDDAWDGLTREALDTALPVHEFQTRGLPRSGLRRLVQDASPRVARVARLVLELQRLRSGPRWSLDRLASSFEWIDSFDPTVVVAWTPESVETIHRVGDDAHQLVMDSSDEPRPFAALMGVPLDGAGLARLTLALRIPVRRLRLADELLGHLGRKL